MLDMDVDIEMYYYSIRNFGVRGLKAGDLQVLSANRVAGEALAGIVHWPSSSPVGVSLVSDRNSP